MTDPQLNPQQPGEIPGVDSSKLTALLDGNVGELVEALEGLTADELAMLGNLERAGKNRTTALSAIDRELGDRADASGEAPKVDREAAGIGDETSYANMRAKDVDPHKLSQPVLTLDGWVVPTPQATPVA